MHKHYNKSIVFNVGWVRKCVVVLLLLSCFVLIGGVIILYCYFVCVLKDSVLLWLTQSCLDSCLQ